MLTFLIYTEVVDPGVMMYEGRNRILRFLGIIAQKQGRFVWLDTELRDELIDAVDSNLNKIIKQLSDREIDMKNIVDIFRDNFEPNTPHLNNLLIDETKKMVEHYAMKFPNLTPEEIVARIKMEFVMLSLIMLDREIFWDAIEKHLGAKDKTYLKIQGFDVGAQFDTVTFNPTDELIKKWSLALDFGDSVNVEADIKKLVGQLLQDAYTGDRFYQTSLSKLSGIDVVHELSHYFKSPLSDVEIIEMVNAKRDALVRAELAGFAVIEKPENGAQQINGKMLAYYEEHFKFSNQLKDILKKYRFAEKAVKPWFKLIENKEFQEAADAMNEYQKKFFGKQKKILPSMGMGRHSFSLPFDKLLGDVVKKATIEKIYASQNLRMELDDKVTLQNLRNGMAELGLKRQANHELLWLDMGNNEYLPGVVEHNSRHLLKLERLNAVTPEDRQKELNQQAERLLQYYSLKFPEKSSEEVMACVKQEFLIQAFKMFDRELFWDALGKYFQSDLKKTGEAARKVERRLFEKEDVLLKGIAEIIKSMTDNLDKGVVLPFGVSEFKDLMKSLTSKMEHKSDRTFYKETLEKISGKQAFSELTSGFMPDSSDVEMLASIDQIRETVERFGQDREPAPVPGF